MHDDMQQEPAWRRYSRMLGFRPRPELADEIEFHLQMRIDEFVRAGLTPGQARSEALKRFGDRPDVERQCGVLDDRRLTRERRTEWLSDLRQDFRFALRTLARRPGFTMIAALTLALGIGATAALFGIVDAVLLRPLVYAHAERTVVLWNSFQQPAMPTAPLSPEDMSDLGDQLRGVENLSAFSDWNANLTGSGEPARLQGYMVSPGFFATLGVTPSLGRMFREEEGRAGNDHVVVLSQDLWRSAFGSDRSVIGRSLQINGEAYMVVGVAPAGVRFPDAPSFLYPERADLWVPHDWRNDRAVGRGARYLRVVGHLRTGTSLAQAQRELDAAAASVGGQYADAYPKSFAWRPHLVPLRDQTIGDVKPALFVLAGAVVLVLLIACANVANLLLAGASSRRSEIAVRMALGASRGRLIRQLLTENVVLALIGGVVATGVSFACLELVRKFGPRSIPRIESVGVDIRMLVFTLGVSIVAASLFGLIPALQQAHGGLQDALRAGSRGMIGGRGRKLLTTLVISEMALSLIVVIGAGLLLRSFVRLLDTDKGYQTAHVLTAHISLPRTSYEEPARRVAFFRALFEKLESSTAVQSAGGSDPLPLSGDGWQGGFAIQGRPVGSDEQLPSVEVSVVTPGLFPALSIALQEGRLLASSDNESAPSVVVVDSTLARRHWPDGNAIGQRIKVTGRVDTSWSSIVGVVRHIRRSGARDEGEPQVYVPFFQEPRSRMYLALRGAGDPNSLIAQLRRAVTELDPALPIAKIRAMDELAAGTSARDRFNLFMLGSFAALATVLAAVGLYGVMAYTVAQRTREMGVRIALGAEPRQVTRMVVGQGMRPALLGLALGLAGSIAISRVMRQLLYQVGSIDAATYVATVGFLVLVSLVACAIPARRAARVDAALSLRAE